MTDGDNPAPAAGPTAAAAAAQFVALKSGLRIRHYIVEEVIGAGGFGITYLARHERLTAKVFALKEFFPREFAARQGTHVVSTTDGRGIFRWGLDRFLKEAEALAKCEHPGIVDVVDYFEENGTAYAVLGYVEGQQLGQWLSGLGRPPTQGELDRVLMPLLDALEVVHGARLLHRDIAPDNIIIRRDGSPCLIDFGACREDIRERSQKVSAIVKQGYSPPEQYHGLAELQGPWTDIYALGATMYRAISGLPPMDATRRGALGDTLEPVSVMSQTEYRPGFMHAIDMALRLKPDERPQSVADWRAMLNEVVPAKVAPLPGRKEPSDKEKDDAKERREKTDDPADPPRPSPGPGPKPVPTRGGLVLAVGLAIVAIIAGVAFLRPAPGPASSGEAGGAAQGTIAGGSGATQGSGTSGQQSATAPGGQRLSATVEPPVDRERLAREAWTVLAASTDRAAIERFIAAHPGTATAATARTRLDDLTRAEERRAALDRQLAACRAAPATDKATACRPVIESDDTPARRLEALTLRGTAHRAAANYDAAIADFTAALALQPGSADLLNHRGIARFLKGGDADRQAALADYTAAVAADARHAEAYNNRAWVLLQLGRAADALPDANRSIELVPTNGYAYDTRGHINEALGRRDAAIRDYERAVAIDATQADSQAALARLRAGR